MREERGTKGRRERGGRSGWVTGGGVHTYSTAGTALQGTCFTPDIQH